MQISPNGIALIRSFEGCRLTIYKDQGGADTIGIGHLLTPLEKATDRFADGITQEEADALLRADLAWVEGQIAKLVKVDLSQNEYDALVSLCFNCGDGPLVGTLGKLLNVGRKDRVPFEMTRWCHGAGGVILPVLVRRRAAEAKLWETPDSPAVA